MNRSYLCMLLWVSVCAGAASNPTVSSTPSETVTVPNFDQSGPPCIANLHTARAQCTADGCLLPLPRKSTMASLEVKLSCVPKLSRTEFDNPQPEATVQAIRARNAGGLVMLINDFQAEPADPKKLLTFCLWGKQTLLCGSSHVRRLKDGVKADGTAAVKSFIKEIELEEPLP